jgi:hypothetical protein
MPGKVEKVLGEFKDKKLRSSSGQKVTNRKQAIAIGLSEARKAGEKVPRRKARGGGRIEISVQPRRRAQRGGAVPASRSGRVMRSSRTNRKTKGGKS